MVLGVLYYVVFYGVVLIFIGDYNSLFKVLMGDFFIINMSKKYIFNFFMFGLNFNYEILIKEKYLLCD